MCVCLWPKQSGFVWICQSGKEKAAVGESFSFFFFFQAIIHQQMAYICLTYIEDILPTLFQLSNHQFEELAMDVYDEVDRRETDAGRIKKKKKTSTYRTL